MKNKVPNIKPIRGASLTIKYNKNLDEYSFIIEPGEVPIIKDTFTYSRKTLLMLLKKIYEYNNPPKMCRRVKEI